MSGGRRVLKRLGIAVLAVLAVYVVADLTGAMDVVRDQERFEQFVSDAGLLGPVVFVVAMTVLVPIGVPGVPLVIAGGAVFPPVVAVTAGVVGGLTSSMIGVVASRRVGRDALEERLPTWLAGFDRKLTEWGVWGVIGLRVVLYVIAPADWVLGLSHVGMREIAVGTAIGLVPPTIGYALFGPDFFRWLITPAGLVSLVAFAVVVGAIVVLRRRAARPTAAQSPPPPA